MLFMPQRGISLLCDNDPGGSLGYAFSAVQRCFVLPYIPRERCKGVVCGSTVALKLCSYCCIVA